MKLRTAHDASSVLWPEFQEIDGSVYLAREVPKAGIARGTMTRTEAESFHNHVHVLDLFDHTIPGHEGADGAWLWDTTHAEFALATDLSRRLGSMWLAKLRLDYPGRMFRIYATRLDDPIVRFHEVHAGEASWLSDEQAAVDVERGDVRIYSTSA